VSFLSPQSIAEGETKELTFIITIPATGLSTGSHTLQLLYDQSNGGTTANFVSLGTASVTIQETPEDAVISLVGSPAFPNSDRVSKLAPQLTATIQNTGGYYSGQVRAYVFPTAGGGSLTSFGNQPLILAQGESKTVVFNSEIGLEPGSYSVALALAGSASTLSGSSLLFTLVEPETDNTLSALTVSGGELTPAFASATQNYTVSVPYTTNSITLTTTTTGTYATVSGDGVQPLAVGDNTFNIVVTAENGSTKTYTVVVTRQEADDALQDTWVTVATGMFTYNGNPHTPTVIVNNGVSNLTPTTDYTVAYSANTNAGTGTITITGAGDRVR
jgi:hypothetical protein